MRSWSRPVNHIRVPVGRDSRRALELSTPPETATGNTDPDRRNRGTRGTRGKGPQTKEQRSAKTTGAAEPLSKAGRARLPSSPGIEYTARNRDWKHRPGQEEPRNTRNTRKRTTDQRAEIRCQQRQLAWRSRCPKPVGRDSRRALELSTPPETATGNTDPDKRNRGLRGIRGKEPQTKEQRSAKTTGAAEPLSKAGRARLPSSPRMARV